MLCKFRNWQTCKMLEDMQYRLEYASLICHRANYGNRLQNLHSQTRYINFLEAIAIYMSSDNFNRNMDDICENV